jgi:hypothetical protein
MLVLALQFSRCGADASRSSLELDASGVRKQSSDSFKTEEKTGPPARPTREGKPTTSLASTTNPPVHQLGVQSPGDLTVADGVEWTP